jgi:hypothetical protein
MLITVKAPNSQTSINKQNATTLIYMNNNEYDVPLQHKGATDRNCNSSLMGNAMQHLH